MSDWVAVVDDDVINLRLASRILNEKDMRVSCLRSGEELLAFLDENRPDLVFLDIHMPGMDGFETITAVRRRSELADLPVIFLTGDEELGTETRGLLMGAVDFIRKPFVSEILTLRVRHTIELARLQNDLAAEVEKKTAEVIAQHERILGLKHAAATDQMTGLLNKQSVQEELGAVVSDTPGTLLMMDLDSFKLVNDLYGHNMGDRILIRFAEILRSQVRSSDIAGRMGGDEFIAFCRNVKDEPVIRQKTENMNRELLEFARSLLGEDMTIPLGVSIGAVVAPDEGSDFLTLYQKADEALYSVKQSGRHGYAFYWKHKRPEGTDRPRDSALAMAVLNERNTAHEAMLLPFESFRLVYRLLVRMNKNYPIENCFLLFTLKTKEGREDLLPELVSRFAETAVSVLRTSDCVTKNSANQCMILLLRTDRKNSESVVGRILHKWNETEEHLNCTLSYGIDWIQ